MSKNECSECHKEYSSASWNDGGTLKTYYPCGCVFNIHTYIEEAAKNGGLVYMSQTAVLGVGRLCYASCYCIHLLSLGVDFKCQCICKQEDTRQACNTQEGKFDNINRPLHYNNSPAKCECGRKIECIDITRHLGFAAGNIMKYLWRYKDKDGIVALKKAMWYLNDLIKMEESQNANQGFDRETIS